MRLSGDFTGEVSSSSSKGCITFDLSQGDESGNTSENDCEDIDDGTNEDEGMDEYEDADEADEGRNGDDSDYNIEVSHNLEGTDWGLSIPRGQHIRSKRQRETYLHKTKHVSKLWGSVE